MLAVVTILGGGLAGAGCGEFREVGASEAASEDLPYAPGEVLVRFRDGFKAGFENDLQIRPLGAASIGGVRRMRLLAEESVESAVERLSRDPAVEYAEPNWKIAIDVGPDDPRYDECWGLHPQTPGASQNGRTYARADRGLCS